MRSVVTLMVSVDAPAGWSPARVLEAVTDGIGWVGGMKQLSGDGGHATLIEAGIRQAVAPLREVPADEHS